MTMKLYRVNGAFPYFVGTQAEAKREARDVKADWELVEVPTDKEGLIAFLNGMEQVDGRPETAQDQQDEVLADEGNDQHVPVLERAVRKEPALAAPYGQRVLGDGSLLIEIEDYLDDPVRCGPGPLGSIAYHVAARFRDISKQAELLA
jgi:hypothetical protein